MRSILDDARLEVESARFREFESKSPIDANKVRRELANDRRPSSPNPYARLLIEAIRVGHGQAAPEPEPPAPVDLERLTRNVMFTAQAPQLSLRAPAHWTVALSADPAFDAAVRAAAPALKKRGPIAVWGVQTQIGAERIRRLASELGAAYAMFQAETPQEYDTAIAAGARVIVGNPNAWTQAQRDDATARARRGELYVLFEVYANMTGVWPDTASSRNVPITTEVLGVGGWEGRPDVQLRDYKPRTPAGVWATMSVYYGESMSDESWGMLP